MNKLSLLLGLCVVVSASALGCNQTVSTGEALNEGEVPTLTQRECTEQGGTLIGDPGDGSTHRDGCPDGRELLGNVPFGIEGAICCGR